MSEALKASKALLDSDELKAHGDACAESGLTEIKDCYEKCFEKIPLKKKGKPAVKGGDGGCCIIF
jgi:hypothetical protein